MNYDEQRLEVQQWFEEVIHYSEVGDSMQMHEAHLHRRKTAPGSFLDIILQSLTEFVTSQYQSALISIEQAITINPRSPLPLALKVVNYISTEQYAQALNACDNAIVVIPKSDVAYEQKAALLIKLGREDEAIETYKQLIHQVPVPDNIFGYVGKGMIISERKRYDEAIPLAEHVVFLNPNHVFAYIYRGRVLEGLYRYQDALKDYERAISLYPKCQVALLQKATLLLLLSHLEESLAAFEQSLLFEPSSAYAHNGKGNMLMALQRDEEALNEYEQATTLLPENKAFRDNRKHASNALKILQFPTHIAQEHMHDSHKIIQNNVSIENQQKPLRSILVWGNYGWDWLVMPTSQFFTPQLFPFPNTITHHTVLLILTRSLHIRYSHLYTLLYPFRQQRKHWKRAIGATDGRISHLNLLSIEGSLAIQNSYSFHDDLLSICLLGGVCLFLLFYILTTQSFLLGKTWFLDVQPYAAPKETISNEYMLFTRPLQRQVQHTDEFFLAKERERQRTV